LTAIKSLAIADHWPYSRGFPKNLSWILCKSYGCPWRQVGCYLPNSPP